jgi:hypothetical protein
VVWALGFMGFLRVDRYDPFEHDDPHPSLLAVAAGHAVRSCRSLKSATYEE